MSTQLPLGRLRSFASRCIRELETFVLLCYRPRRRSQNVVVVRLDAIGDFVLWLDAAKELKQLYPGRKITLLANSIWAEVAAALPYWDEVWPVNVPQLRRHSYYRWKLLQSIRKRGFDVALQPTYSRSFLEGDALVRGSGARERIGSIGDYRRIQPWQKRISDCWYTRLLPTSRDVMMELERNAEFVRNLGRKGFAAAIPVLPQLAVLPEHLRIPRPYLILFPGASWSGKQWPPDRFAELANDLARNKGLKAVVCGSAADSAVCKSVVESASVEVLDLSGQTSLPQFVELVRGARLLIGNDTSAVHIAAAVGTPAVCILGGGHYGRFLPYQVGADVRTAPRIALHHMPCFGCNWVCTQPHEEGAAVPCVSGVSVRDVLEASQQVLSECSARLSA